MRSLRSLSISRSTRSSTVILTTIIAVVVAAMFFVLMMLPFSSTRTSAVEQLPEQRSLPGVRRAGHAHSSSAFAATATSRGFEEDTIFRRVETGTGERVSQTRSRSVVVIWEDDMETGSNNWDTTSPWSLTSTEAHSPTHSWTDSPNGNYQNMADCLLSMSVDVDLSGVSEPELEFWHYTDIENGWDGGIIDYSTNQGSSWSQLDAQNSQNNYDDTISSGYGNPLAGKWGFTGNSYGWQKVTFDLATFQGEDHFRIRFHFASDSSVQYDGWYIDDVAFKDVAANFPPLAPSFVPVGSYEVGTAGSGVIEDPVRLTWDCTDNDGDMIESFRLHIGTDTGMNSDAAQPDIFADHINGSPAADHYDLDVGDGITYYWAVKAFDGQLWGPWSPEFSFITNIQPNATIDKIADADGDPISTSYEDAEVFFYGNGSDLDGTVTDYKWESNYDGFLSDQPSFMTDALSINSHIISFLVKDSDGEWSEASEQPLQVGNNDPPSIDAYSPNNDALEINTGETVDFSVSASDPQVDVSELYVEWYLDTMNNNVWSGFDFRFFSDQYTVGDHTLRVVVSDGVLEDRFAWTIHINGPPTITYHVPTAQSLPDQMLRHCQPW